MIKLEADISFDVTVCIKERQEVIEKEEIAVSEEDFEIQADIMELLEDYQKASELNMTRNIWTFSFHFENIYSSFFTGLSFLQALIWSNLPVDGHDWKEAKIIAIFLIAWFTEPRST